MLTGTISLLRNRNFRFFCLANLFGDIPLIMQSFVLVWLISELAPSITIVSITTFCFGIPFLVFGSFSGYIAQKFNRPLILILVHSIKILTSISLAIFIFTDSFQITHGLIAATILGIANSFAFTSRRSLTLHLIDKNKASASTATDYIGLGICALIGPSLSGFIIKEIGSGYTQIIIGLFSFAALLTLLQIINTDKKETVSSIKENNKNIKKHPSIIQFIINQPILLVVLGLGILTNIFTLNYHFLAIIISKTVLLKDVQSTGILLTAGALGFFIIVLLLSSLSEIKSKLFIIIPSFFGAVISIMLFALSKNYLLSYLMLALVGISNGIFIVMQIGIIGKYVSKELVPRVIGINTTLVGIGPFGALILGKLSDIYNPQMSLIICGTGCIIIGTLTLLPLIKSKITNS